MRRKIYYLTGLALMVTFGLPQGLATPALAQDQAVASELSQTEIEADAVFAPTNTDLIEFTIDARWGYVRGNVHQDQTEKNYSGSIYPGTATEARVSLLKKLLFEKTDQITSSSTPLAWTSKIYGHWDGVLAQVLAKGEADIVVKAGNFVMTKTAKDWFNLTEPAIERATDGQMLVIKVNKKPTRRHNVIVWWGKKSSEDSNCTPTICPLATTSTVNFSGSLVMDTDAFVKLKKPLRFERGDAVTEQDRNHLAWQSTITNDRDGLLTFILPNRDAGLDSGLTINFSQLSSPWTKHFTFEDIKNGVRETISVNSVDYLLVIGRKNIVRQLVKANLSRRLYLIEDNVKHEVNNNDVLAAHGLSEAEAEIMDDDELNSFETGANLNYPDGTVVEDTTDTYVIENGLRRKLANAEVIKSFLDARRLFARRISQLRLNEFSLGSDITEADTIIDGALVKVAGDSAVWKIEGNTRKIFTQLKIFELHKFNFNQVKTITPAELAEFDWAPPLAYPDGALVKIPTDPKVYLLHDGKRRWVETEEDLKALGFSFSDIVDMPPTDIANYPEGDPMITP